jgi:hypothetical protein
VLITTSALARGRGGGGKLRTCSARGLLLASELFLWGRRILGGNIEAVGGSIAAVPACASIFTDTSDCDAADCIIDFGETNPEPKTPDAVDGRRESGSTGFGLP